MCSLRFLGLPAIKQYNGLTRSYSMGVVCGTQSPDRLGLRAHDVHIRHVLRLIWNVFKNSNTRPLYRDTVPLRTRFLVPNYICNLNLWKEGTFLLKTIIIYKPCLSQDVLYLEVSLYSSDVCYLSTVWLPWFIDIVVLWRQYENTSCFYFCRRMLICSERRSIAKDSTWSTLKWREC